ncbi:type II toxin-antitoxin system RelE/ParE family toxin [Phycisphaeraceae bacterium D3-23]
MSREVLISPIARSELVSLYVWYEAEGGLELAQQFRATTTATLDDLAEQPGLGRLWEARRTKLKGLRKWNVGKPFGSVLIFYRITTNGIEVLRFLRGERDLDAELSED